MTTTETPPIHLLPKAGTLKRFKSQCRFCTESIYWGKTQGNRWAPFDTQAPHANHWSTCKRADQARKDNPRR